MYMNTKNEVPRSLLSNIGAHTGQTDTQTRPNALPSALTDGNCARWTVSQICIMYIIGFDWRFDRQVSKSPRRKRLSSRSPSHKSKQVSDKRVSHHKSSRHAGSSDVKLYSSATKRRLSYKDSKPHRLKKHRKTKKSHYRSSSSSSLASSRSVSLASFWW